MFVVISLGRERWDIDVFGPYKHRLPAEKRAQRELDAHPHRTVGVYPTKP